MEEEKTHQRSESVYSMDSFVADFPSREGEKSSSPSPDKVRPQTYFSPSSSANTTPASATAAGRNTNIFQDTIDMASFSNDTPVPRQAPNPFFSPSYYDDFSEVSDGSFVVHETPSTPVGQKPPYQPQQQQSYGQAPHSTRPPSAAARKGDGRDRFPSFDSVGSSGSLQYVGKAKPPSKPTPPPANAPLTMQQIQQLPYHERRKLLAQRRAEQEKQQQQLQQQQQQQPTPLPGMPYGRPGMPPPQQIPPPPQASRSERNMPPPPPPQQVYSPYMMPPPPPPDMFYANSPVMMQHPLHSGQPPYGRPPYPGVPPPPVGPGYGNFPPGMPFYPPGPGYPVPPPPPHMAAHRGGSPMQTRPTAKDHLQTTGLPRGYTGGPALPGQDRKRSSSLDSSDDKDSNRGRQRNVPPPPPPPPAGGHVRVDSSGSLSSLDKSSSVRGDDDSEPNKRAPEKNFLARLNPWAPKVPNVDDYHRKNQAFLKRATMERQRTPSPSPKQEVRKVRLGSSDRPPPSRGTHKRLPSIEGDDWEEKGTSSKMSSKSESRSGSSSGGGGIASGRIQRTYSSGEDSGYSEERPRSRNIPPRFKHKADTEADERASLLPPPGISSNEQYDRSGRGSYNNPDIYGSIGATVRIDNTARGQWEVDQEKERKNRKKKKKAKGRSRRSRPAEDSASYSSSSASSQDYQRWMKKRSRLLEKERTKLMKKWREEAREEEEAARMAAENKRWYNRLGRYMDSEFGSVFESCFKFLTWAEAFVANIPLTINAIALATANLGVVWFKFAEENMQSCEPVHYHSSQCTFPEFPGCFYCDTDARMYKIAVNFHWGCSIVAGILASLFVCKLIIAPKVVFDELGSPTTAAPAGLLCMTLDIVFAGRGIIGQAVGTFIFDRPVCKYFRRLAHTQFFSF